VSESTKSHRAEAPERLKFGVFICSTSRYKQLEKINQAEDASGDLIECFLKKTGQILSFRKIIPDDATLIKESMCLSINSDVDVVIFCGGTGISASDITIETVAPFFEKDIPGFGETFRRLSYDLIGSATFLSRAVAGVIRGKIIFCVPGSIHAVKLCLEKLILPESRHLVKHARE
jgi:molybdenum cofactor biosynthesis protein B